MYNQQINCNVPKSFINKKAEGIRVKIEKFDDSYDYINDVPCSHNEYVLMNMTYRESGEIDLDVTYKTYDTNESFDAIINNGGSEKANYSSSALSVVIPKGRMSMIMKAIYDEIVSTVDVEEFLSILTENLLDVLGTAEAEIQNTVIDAENDTNLNLIQDVVQIDDSSDDASIGVTIDTKGNTITADDVIFDAEIETGFIAVDDIILDAEVETGFIAADDIILDAEENVILENVITNDSVVDNITSSYVEMDDIANESATTHSEFVPSIITTEGLIVAENSVAGIADIVYV